jgi:uracil-DNA glycosylase family 4
MSGGENAFLHDADVQLLPASVREMPAYFADEWLRARFPLPPLDAPGLAQPGPDVERCVDMLAGECPPLRPIAKGTKKAEREAIKAANQAVVDGFAPRRRRALAYTYLHALYDPFFSMEVVVNPKRGQYAAAQLVQGVRNNDEYQGHGPWPAGEVMVIGKWPGADEEEDRSAFVGRGAQPLLQALEELGLIGTFLDADKQLSYTFKRIDHWYWTNFCKWRNLAPDQPNILGPWKRDCWPLLQMEMRLVRPDYILCLGSDASKALLGPKGGVTSLFGRVVDYKIPLHGAGETPRFHVAKVVASVHPAEVSRDPRAYPNMLQSVARFSMLARGEAVKDREPDVTHVCIYDLEHLRQVVDKIVAETEGGVQAIAVDCEWQGRVPGEPGAYLRTIQWCHRPKEAYCLVLAHEGGKAAFQGTREAAAAELRRLLKSTPLRRVRVGGHFLKADMPWLVAFGVDARDEYRVAPTPGRTRDEGGFDTALMVHGYQEVMEGGYKLENLASRFCGVPRYDTELQQWKSDYIKLLKMKDKELEGYGMCPGRILYSYGAYDADATMRLFLRFNGSGGEPGLIDDDQYHKSGREGYWNNMQPSMAQLEMEGHGLVLDRRRGDLLTRTYMAELDERIAGFRRDIRWEGEWRESTRKNGKARLECLSPPFNHNSVDHCREWLFGAVYTGKDRRLRPRRCRSLKLTPIKASGSKGPLWSKVVADGKQFELFPSTDKESLGILSHASDEATNALVGRLRDLRFLSQVLKGVLRKPYETADGEAVCDEDGNLIYDGGLLFHAGHDGRVRTHFGVVETSRWSSWAPNLQNISKRREDDYKRILREKYRYPIRSIVVSGRWPDGTPCVLVEADYKMAEMAMIGWLAQDAAMMEHVRRNTLPEGHPDYLDLHSLTAIGAFRLDTPENRAIVAKKAATDPKYAGLKWGANKLVLKALERSSLRVAAKNVNFGVPYQRSAEAIARQCREEGADVAVEQAQELIDNYFDTYPAIAEYLAACKLRVYEPGWISGTWGHYRRAQRVQDESLMAEQQRQFCNFPIQNGVAGAINVACRNLYKYRAKYGTPASNDRWFKFALQIHDALLFEVPVPALEWFLDDVLRPNMATGVDVVPRTLDGEVIDGVGPYHLDIDTEIFHHWGVGLDAEWAEHAGVPARFYKKHAA